MKMNGAVEDERHSVCVAAACAAGGAIRGTFSLLNPRQKGPFQTLETDLLRVLVHRRVFLCPVLRLYSIPKIRPW